MNLSAEWELEGQVVIVTGGTSGIGKAAATELARMGATVVLVARNAERGEEVQQEIRAAAGHDNIRFYSCDLSSQNAIRGFAARFRRDYDRLDVLVNNAGAFYLTRRESVEGLEKSFALNHMSYFVLTHLLLDILKASAPARIVNVSSNAHRVGRITFDDLQRRQKYRFMNVYGESKLMNILFTFELARRLEGSGVTANTLHPGFVRTNLAHNNGLLARIGVSIAQLFGISPEKGAETVVYLAASPEVAEISGEYFEKKRVTAAHAYAYNIEAQQKLWQISHSHNAAGTLPVAAES